MKKREFTEKVNNMFNDYPKGMYYKSLDGEFMPNAVTLNENRILFFWTTQFGIYDRENKKYDYLSPHFYNLELYFDDICIFKELILPKYI